MAFPPRWLEASFSLLTGAERAWIDAYHARVLKTLGHRLPDETAQWLASRCRPL